MTFETIYNDGTTTATYDTTKDEVQIYLGGSITPLSFFTLEKITDAAREAHIKRNNEMIKEDETIKEIIERHKETLDKLAEDD